MTTAQQATQETAPETKAPITLDFDKDVIKLICNGGKEQAIENFKVLLQEKPDDSISRLLQNPQVNGIIPKTRLFELAFTPENLAKLATPGVLTSKGLSHVLRSVGYDQRTGKAEAIVDAGKAYAILDALVAAGARLDTASAEGGQYHLSDAKREDLQKKMTIPAKDETLETPEAVKEYVDRLVALDAAVIGNNLDRVKGTRLKPWKMEL